MFPPLYVTIAFFLMVMPGFTFGVQSRWLSETLKRIILVAGTAAAIYVFAAGVHLYGGWDEWMASRPGSLDEGVSHARRGGLIILFITYLPYALMGLSGYVLYYLRYPISRMFRGQTI